jgi:hypothetical protein
VFRRGVPNISLMTIFFLFYFSFNPFDGCHLLPRRWLFSKRMVIAWYGVARTVVSALWDFFSVRGWERGTAGAWLRDFFSLQSRFRFFCMHGVGMMFMPNLGAAYEAWCFSFIYDTLRQDNIRLNERTYTIYSQSFMSSIQKASPHCTL